MSNVKNPRRDMTRGSEWECLLMFALPLMAGQLLQQLYSTADGIVVGNFVSESALAAVGNCINLVNLFICVSVGLGNGCAILVSQYYGAGMEREQRDSAVSAVTLMAGLGIVLGVLTEMLAVPAVDHLLVITDEGIRADAIAYIRIGALGFVFTFVYNAVASVLRAVGDSRALLYFLMVSAVMNIVLDIAFVAGLGWGVAGAAAATVISQLACAVVSFLYMQRNYPVFRFGRGRLKPGGKSMLMCVRLGMPSTIQQLAVTGGHLLLQRLVNSFGPVTMTAFTVGSRFELYCSVPSMALFQAMASFAGQNVGANRYERVGRGLRICVLLNLFIIVPMNLLMFIFAPGLAALFGVADASLEQAVEFLRFCAVTRVIFAVYIPFSGMFQGCGDPMASAAVSLLALGSRVLVSYIMVYVFSMGYASCWQSCLVGWSIALVYCLVHYRGGKWRSKSVIKDNKA